MKEYKKLISEYQSIKDDLLDYTTNFYDNMAYDIDGYIAMYSDEDYDDIESLRNQVKSFRLILNGMKKVDYVFC